MEELPEDKWNEFATQNKMQIVLFISYFEENRNLIKELSTITEFRNDFMHCGMRKNRKNARKLIDKVVNSYSKFISLLN